MHRVKHIQETMFFTLKRRSVLSGTKFIFHKSCALDTPVLPLKLSICSHLWPPSSIDFPERSWTSPSRNQARAAASPRLRQHHVLKKSYLSKSLTLSWPWVKTFKILEYMDNATPSMGFKSNNSTVYNILHLILTSFESIFRSVRSIML